MQMRLEIDGLNVCVRAECSRCGQYVKLGYLPGAGPLFMAHGTTAYKPRDVQLPHALVCDTCLIADSHPQMGE